jgi:hypothetical protein
MLLLKENLVELHYDVTSDLLSMKWPELTGLTISQIQHSLRKVIDTLKHYDVKHFLVDSRDNLLEVSAQEHRDVRYQFSADLRTTRVSKMARIASTNLSRGDRTHQVAREIAKDMNFNLQYQEFDDEEAALSWLRK